MMNIQDAKDSVKDAIETYLSKDEAGNYMIPRERQRPVMLIGAPGLGKTAIMSQIAAELGIGFVSYTITHHTRQSAIGLPMIEKSAFGGEEYTVTRYTMSEIIASVYDAIEEGGKTEGILFIDEINCVSETLAPAMLDLLQNKKFGPHRIPDGWVLAAAGNPQEFNDSAREFDIATLDRIRVIEVEADADVWIRYAVNAGINDAVIYYLKLKPQNLLKIERDADGTHFVTPRAWEDLSVVLNEYESNGIWAGITLISQYIRDPETASEFAKYRDFYRKYSNDFNTDSILAGTYAGKADNTDPEGRLAVISVLTGKLNSESSAGMDLKYAAELLRNHPDMTLKEMRTRLRSNLTPEERKGLRFAMVCRSRNCSLEELEQQLADAEKLLDARITNAAEFVRGSFGEGPETVALLTGLLSSYSTVMFSKPGGSLYRYNEEILVSARNRHSGGLR